MTIRRSAWAIPYGIFLIAAVALPLIMIAVYAFRTEAGVSLFKTSSSSSKRRKTFILSSIPFR